MMTFFKPPSPTESERLQLFAHEAPSTKIEALKIVTHASRVRAWGWTLAAVMGALGTFVVTVLVKPGWLPWLH